MESDSGLINVNQCNEICRVWVVVKINKNGSFIKVSAKCEIVNYLPFFSVLSFALFFLVSPFFAVLIIFRMSCSSFNVLSNLFHEQRRRSWGGGGGPGSRPAPPPHESIGGGGQTYRFSPTIISTT